MPKTLKTLGDAKKTGQELLAICHTITCRHSRAVDLDVVIKHVGEMHPLVPRKMQVHFSERMRCPACGSRGMYIWLGLPKDPVPFYNSMSYAVNLWSPMEGALDRALAKTGHLQVAHAAYEAGIRAYPGRHLTLQQGALLLRDSRWRLIDGGLN